LSAQTCSLSLNTLGCSCREAITGRIQACLSPAAAACRSSVRDTPIASIALTVVLPGKFEVKLAKYSRGPLLQENPLGPGRGPNARRVQIFRHSL